MKQPRLPLEQDNSYASAELCGWWAIGRECVRTEVYPTRARNLVRRVMTDVAAHVSHGIDQETFMTVWGAWKSSKQVETTLKDYTETLKNNPTL